MKALIPASIILTGCLFSTFSVTAQTHAVSKEAMILKKVGTLKPADKIKIIEVGRISEPEENGTTDGSRPFYGIRYCTGDGKEGVIRSKKLIDKICFQDSTLSDYWDGAIINKVFPHLDKNGDQNEMRENMATNSMAYINKIRESDNAFDDIKLQTYVSNVMYKIAPQRYVDGRKSNVSITVVNDLTPNAFVLPNGATAITIGLLTELQSEDELAAVLAHEMTHFVFEHQIANVTQEIKREKRALAWSMVAATTAMVAETVVSYKTDGAYIPGDLSASTFALATSISASVLYRLGMKYNQQQEFEADATAKEVTMMLGYDPNAMATVLHRIQKYCIDKNDKSALMSSYTHPSLNDRINVIGKPVSIRDSVYDNKVAPAITRCAIQNFRDKDYRKAIALADRNIYTGQAISDDYIIKAGSILKVESTPEKARYALLLIENAKKMDPESITPYRYEIAAHFIVDNPEKALQTMQDYKNALLKRISELKDNDTLPGITKKLKAYYNELDWVEKTTRSYARGDLFN